MKKRILPLVMAVLLLMGILPTAVFAADSPETYYWAVLKYTGADLDIAAEFPKLIIASEDIEVGADFEYYTTDDADATADQKAGHGTFLSSLDVNEGIEKDEEYIARNMIPWRLRYFPELKSVSVTGDISPVSTAHWFDCSEMPQGTGYRILSGIDLSGIDTSAVTDMSYMFRGCNALMELDVSDLDTSAVTNMRYMFGNCPTLTDIYGIKDFDTSAVTDMNGMFIADFSLRELDVSGWDTGNVTDIGNMFFNCPILTELDVSGWDTTEVTDMSYTFCNCYSLTDLAGIGDWDTADVTDMSYMFCNCYALTGLESISNFDTSKVTDMSYMFCKCLLLAEPDISDWDTSEVTDMSGMFSGCTALTAPGVSSWDTAKVTDVSYMFSGCKLLTELNLSSWDASSVTDAGHMFSGCRAIKKLAIPAIDYPENAFADDTFDIIYTAGSSLPNAESAVASIILNGGEISGFEDGYISSPTQSGKVFLGYFGDSGFTAEIAPDTNGKYEEPAAPMTYYAKWQDDTADDTEGTIDDTEEPAEDTEEPEENTEDPAEDNENTSGGTHRIPEDTEEPAEATDRALNFYLTGGECKRDETCPIYPFTDSDTMAWYHDGVHYCIENGLMKGVGGDLFAPDGTMTRAMLVTVLYRIEGEPAFMNGNIFSDLVEGSWYEKAVVWANGKGVVLGYGDGRFGPEDPVTREQMAAILYRYAQYKELDVSVDENTNFLSFNDFFDISEYAKPAMMWAVYYGLIQGDGNMNLLPRDSASRAQVATILHRYCRDMIG